MTRTYLAVLAGLAGFSHAQQVSVTVKLANDAENLEYNTEQKFTCSWEADSDLLTAGIDLNSEPLQIKWFYQGDAIYTMEAESYEAFPHFGTAFIDRDTTVASANASSGFSTLTLGNVKLSDVGDYKCRVSLQNPKEISGKKAYVSGNGELEGVKVFAKPIVSFVDLNLEHDTRAVQYAAFLESLPKPTEAVFETTGSAEEEALDSSEIEESTESSESTESNEISRKKRQAEETAVPEVEATTSDVKTVLGSCDIANAYPAPSEISVFIGEEKIAILGEEDFSVNQNSEGLFDTQVSFSSNIDGASQNGQAIKCAVSDSEKMYEVEAVSEVLDVKYLPTSISAEADPVVFEGEPVTINCVSNGNPAPVLTLVHLSDANINEKINGSSSFKIESAVRNSDYQFKCIASYTNGSDYSQFVKESEPINVKVNYLEIPVVEVDGEHSEPEADNFIVKQGSKVTMSCEAEADPVAKYYWFKNDEPIGESNTLIIEEAKWSDDGVYYCKAENGLPENAKKSLPQTISVQGQCQVKEIKVVAGKVDKEGKQDATLECVIDTDVKPACSIDWIYKSTVFDTKKDGDKLTLKGVNAIDDSLLLGSTVTCRAKNSFTSYQPTSVLQGKEIAKKLEAPGSSIPWMWVGGIVLVLAIVIFMVNKSKKNKKPESESEATKGEAV